MRRIYCTCLSSAFPLVNFLTNKKATEEAARQTAQAPRPALASGRAGVAAGVPVSPEHTCAQRPARVCAPRPARPEANRARLRTATRSRQGRDLVPRGVKLPQAVQVQAPRGPLRQDALRPHTRTRRSKADRAAGGPASPWCLRGPRARGSRWAKQCPQRRRPRPAVGVCPRVGWGRRQGRPASGGCSPSPPSPRILGALGTAPGRPGACAGRTAGSRPPEQGLSVCPESLSAPQLPACSRDGQGRNSPAGQQGEADGLKHAGPSASRKHV